MVKGAPAHPPWASRTTATAARIGRPMPGTLVVERYARLAFTTGVLRPRIDATTHLLELLTAEEVIAVICHERAHIMRRDNLWYQVSN